jgi:hypothetical protein
MNETQTRYWISNSGRIELEMTLEQAQSVSHSGACDTDVRALSNLFDIRTQIDRIDSEILKQELNEYGTWADQELFDKEDNLQRLVWIAGCDIAESETTEEFLLPKNEQ